MDLSIHIVRCHAYTFDNLEEAQKRMSINIGSNVDNLCHFLFWQLERHRIHLVLVNMIRISTLYRKDRFMYCILT
jgi:hypothetical protein